MLRVAAVGAVYKNDKPDLFRLALDSVLNQTFSCFDTFVVIDGPIGRDLKVVVDEFADSVVFLQNKSSQGLGLALANLFETLIYGKYDIAIRFDADDVNYPERFSFLVSEMERDKLDLVGSNVTEVDENGNWLGVRRVPRSLLGIQVLKSVLNPFNHPSIAIRISKLMEVGGYEHFQYHEDWLLWLKFLKAKARVHNIDKELVYFRVTSKTHERRFGRQYRKLERAFYLEAIRRRLMNPVFAIFGLLIRQLSKMLGLRIFARLYKLIRNF